MRAQVLHQPKMAHLACQPNSWLHAQTRQRLTQVAVQSGDRVDRAAAVTRRTQHCDRKADAYMFQLQLSTRSTEGGLLLEELAELFNLLAKGVTLAANVNGLSLLKRR